MILLESLFQSFSGLHSKVFSSPFHDSTRKSFPVLFMILLESLFQSFSWFYSKVFSSPFLGSTRKSFLVIFLALLESFFQSFSGLYSKVFSSPFHDSTRKSFPVLFMTLLESLFQSFSGLYSKVFSSPFQDYKSHFLSLVFTDFPQALSHQHHKNDDVAACQTQRILEANDQSARTIIDSWKPTPITNPVNCRLNNQDIDHSASATRHVWLSDRQQIPGHTAINTSWPEHQGLFQIL